MKRKFTFTLLTFLMYLGTSFAQCDDPAPPGQSCQEATFFCDGEINGFCSTLAGPNGAVPNPLCPGGGVPNNIEWIAFAAGSTSITISVTPSNCQAQGNQMGVQAGIYGTCPDSGSPTDAIVCNANCETAMFQLTANTFVIGQVYYLFIDGCAGDICDYALAVTNGSTAAPTPGPLSPPVGPLTTCQGQSGVLYTVPEGLFVSNYTWTVPPGATQTDANGLGNEIFVDFGSTGGQICVQGDNDCHPSSQGPVCIDVVVIPPPMGMLNDTYCSGSSYSYDGGEYFEGVNTVTLEGQSYAGCDSVVTLTLTEFDLPPVDVYEGYCQGGFYTYPGDNMDYSAGDYQIVFFSESYQGCDSTVNLHVEEYLPTELILEIAICQTEQYEICYGPYDITGNYAIDCSPNFRGCDSTIILDLLVLEPLADIAPPEILGCGNNSSIYLDGLGSIGTEYMWTTVDGDICDDPAEPFIQVCLPGTYCLEVTESANTIDQGLVECTDQMCVVVTSNSTPPLTSSTSTDIACNGEMNGTATVSVSNPAIGPFTYEWTPNVSITNSASGLGAGVYTVVITAQGNGCISEETITINEPAAIAIPTTQIDLACNGDTNGSATANPTGGTTPFTYMWCNSQTTQTATGLPAGSCTVVVTDASGCSQTTSVTIAEPTPVATTITPVNVDCNGASSGSATANPSGGTGPYTFVWCNTQTTQTATGLPAGPCSVVVTDASGCTVSESVTLIEPAAMVLTTSQTNVLCNGDMNGTATVDPSGGLGPYTYTWCNTQTTQTATGLGVGPCSVVVTDANGCTQSTSVDLTAPNAMTLTTSQTNVLCDGGTNGTATAMPDGGTSPFTYLWCNGQTAPTATGLPAGPCNVVVTDANGCTQSADVTLTAPVAMQVMVSQTDILCNGGNDGTGTATPSGGVGPYTYQWCNGQTGATTTNLGLGPCQVIVTDANGCTEVASVDIGESSSITVDVTSTDVLCFEEDNGTATATPSGGAGGYTYLWCNGETTATATGLSAGACLVVVTDVNGCSETQSVTLSEPTQLSVSASGTDLSCAGAEDGTATATPSGGVGPFTLVWCDGQTTTTATDLPAGGCQVVVTDANGCTNTAFVDLQEPLALELSVTFDNVTCFGASNGTATVSPTGGTGSYSYMWCNGQGTATATGLDAGTCDVLVTDGNGCTQTISVDLTQPASALEIEGTSMDASCGTDNGSISLTVNGGTDPYTYAWSGGADPVDNPSGLGPGNYTVTVTDANDCTETFSIGVDTPTGLDASAAWTDVSCNGGADGTIDVTVMGGNGPYEYTWDTPLIPTDSPSGVDLPADDYNVTVSDADGCTFVTSATVVEPQIIEIDGNSTDETCGESNGTISTSIQGGTEPYTFNWNNGDNTANITDLTAGNYVLDLVDANGCTATFEIAVSTPNELELSTTFGEVSCNGGANGSIDLEVSGGIDPFTYDWSNSSTIQDPQNLTAGIYTVVVTDDTGCSITTQVEITEPTPVMATNLVQQATCGDDNGGVSLTVSGGTEPYTYLWSNGDMTDNPTGLAPDTYLVTVTDDNGCSIIETIEVDEPQALALTVSSTMTSCFQGTDGTIDLEVSGGTFPFTYVWSNSSIEQDPTNLAPGMYTVVVTDANDCTEETSITVGEPTEIEINGSSTNATCGETNGSVSVSASGGTTPYTYAWTGTPSTEPDPSDLGPGNYCVIVTDANGCTNEFCIDVETPDGLLLETNITDVECFGATGGLVDLEVMGGVGPFTYDWGVQGTDEDLSDLPAGVYDVVVTDEATGCTIVTSATVAQPDAIAIDGSSNQATCGDSNGSIGITVTGGTGPYTYLWTPGGDTSPNPTDLAADDYTVEVTDANGCTETYAITVNTPPVLESSAVGTDVSCFGGSDGIVDITVTGGTMPYTYVWSNGSTDEDPTNFSAGTITGTVTDLNGCTSEVTLDLSEPEAIDVTGTTTDESCGEMNGTITLDVTGGTAPFNYVWAQGLGNTPTPVDLAAGDYSVIVTDANGCTFEYATAVSTPNAIVLSAVVDDVDCNGAADGGINLSISGGLGTFTQEWTGGWTGEDLENAPAGVYTVIVTDMANGCTETLTETISEPTAITIDGTSTDALCGSDNGTIDINVSGGTGAYTYLWSPGGSTDEDPVDLGIGNYTVVVTDANMCTETFEIAVQTPNGLALTPTAFDANCNGASDGSVTTSVVGGTAPFTYLWSDGATTTPDLTGVPAGTYIVTVTDADDCEVVASAIVGEPDAIAISGNPTSETCNSSNGTITTSVTGGTGAGTYTYMWTPSGSSDANPVGLDAMDHTVVVTDANGCTGTATFTVDAPNAIVGSLNPTNISCDGGTDGTIEAAIFGGTAPYTYQWSPMGGTDAIATNLPVGDYTVLVTDADDCTFTLTETLTAPPAIVIDGVTTDATCGESNGSIDLTVTGGTGAYTYDWTPALPGMEDPTNVSAGTYTCVVTDANDCTATYDITVNTPGMLTADATGTDVLCNGGNDGTGNVIPNGGTGPYTYLWMPGGSTDANPTDLTAGTYTVAVTDATDCTITASVTIDEPAAITITDTTSPATCGMNNGTANITVVGGTEPYSYLWSTGSTVEDPSDFGAGGYIVTVTDANDCTATHDITIGAPNEPNITLTPTDVLCNGGADGGVNLTISAGVPPFTFNWSNGSTTEDISGLSANTYTVTVTDNDGCPYEYSIDIAEPAPVTAAVLNPTNVSCNGDNNGSANLDVIGGVGPYTYQWSPSGETVQNPTNLPAGLNTVVVTDANGCTVEESFQLTQPDELELASTPTATDCNGSADGSIDLTVSGGTAPFTFAWSNATTDEDPADLTAGVYVVLVTDDNGCTQTMSVTVDEPDEVQVAMINISEYGAYNLSCENSADGSAQAIVSGGVGPFTYLWDNGTTNAELSGVPAGTYGVEVTDANGCTGTSEVTLEAPEGAFVSFFTEGASCFGDDDGFIFVDSTGGGTLPFQYSINGGELDPSGLFGSLTGGQYDILIQDANGCESTETVQVDEPSEIKVVLPDDFSIQLGEGPLDLEAVANLPIDSAFLTHWEWSQGRFFTQDTCTACPLQEINPLETTLYEFGIIDTTGCTARDEILITVRKDRKVYIPNAFSPNGDGYNDIFYIQSSIELERVKTFKIYNRWGEVVFELSNFFANDPNNGWNGMFKGEMLNQAVFVFYAEVEFKDGRVEVLQGDVTLLR